MMDESQFSIVETFELLKFRAELTPESVLVSLLNARFPQNDKTLKRVMDLLPLGKRSITPKGVGRIYRMDSFTTDQQGLLPKQIQEAEYLFLAIATAGTKVDDEARKLRGQGKLVDSMVIDSIALTSLTQATSCLASAVHQWAAQRRFSSSRAFSPGVDQVQWGLSNQQLLFNRLPADAIGVRLTPSFLMVPAKSMSFVMGIGNRINQVDDPFSCAACSRVDCTHRHEIAAG